MYFVLRLVEQMLLVLVVVVVAVVVVEKLDPLIMVVRPVASSVFVVQTRSQIVVTSCISRPGCHGDGRQVSDDVIRVEDARLFVARSNGLERGRALYVRQARSSSNTAWLWTSEHDPWRLTTFSTRRDDGC